MYLPTFGFASTVGRYIVLVSYAVPEYRAGFSCSLQATYIYKCGHAFDVMSQPAWKVCTASTYMYSRFRLHATFLSHRAFGTCAPNFCCRSQCSVTEKIQNIRFPLHRLYIVSI